MTITEDPPVGNLSIALHGRRWQVLPRLSFEGVFLAVFYVLFFWLACLFPRTGDDWAWGSQIGLDRLSTFFADYNGRYAGNLAVLLLTRTPVLTPLVTAAAITLTLFLVLDLAGCRTWAGYLVVGALFCGMPQGVWRQSVAWLSGFSNYALAALCMLVYLRAAKQHWIEPPRPVGVFRCLAILCIGFVSQLFMEHVTLYLVVASCASLVLLRLVRGQFSVPALCWAVSLVAGAVAMFSNGAYRAAANADGSRYQQIQPVSGRSGLLDLVRKLADVVSSLAVVENVLLNGALVLVVCLLVGTRTAVIGRARTFGLVGLAGIFLALTYVLVDAAGYFTRLAFRGLAGVSAGVLLLLLLGVGWMAVRDMARRAVLYVACGSIVVLVAPLVVANPIGPRNFYPTYVCFLIIVGILLRELQEALPVGSGSAFAFFGGALLVALFASRFMVYGAVNHVANQRLAEVRTQVQRGAPVVKVERLPFTGWVHAPDPAGSPWDYRYKLFYDIPQRVKFTMINPG